MGIKETIAKVLNKDTSLADKIQMLFREQGIMIASILRVSGMAIGVASQWECNDSSKGGENVKDWLRNKPKALASLPGRLGMKVA